jgi:hypothetical protein
LIGGSSDVQENYYEGSDVEMKEWVKERNCTVGKTLAGLKTFLG